MLYYWKDGRNMADFIFVDKWGWFNDEIVWHEEIITLMGHNDYGLCHGLARDGRMVGSTTYYFGLAWNLDLDGTGNEVQTDEYTADLTFRVEQHRNNPNPFPTNGD